MEGPVFEFPLQDTVASVGTEVLLKCIIAGTPLPEGKHTVPWVSLLDALYNNCVELILRLFRIYTFRSFIHDADSPCLYNWLCSGCLVNSFVCLSCFSVHKVTWKRDNTEITANANYVIKMEGERHTLLIKSTKPSDAGNYCVTAVNNVGKVSSSATLTIKAGKSSLVKCRFSDRSVYNIRALMTKILFEKVILIYVEF